MPTSILDVSQSFLVNARNPSETLPLSALWKEKPVVLLFLRRLGCPICRAYIQALSKGKQLFEELGAQLVCLSFEAIGEGSDFDHSFEAGKYWTGPLYVIDKSVYAQLFGRKGFFDNFYGLLDMKKEALQAVKDQKVEGNYRGDGFQLGGQFVVDPRGTVHLDHRQKLFGDDATFGDLLKAVEKCKMV
jgi:prostamide/prostaglandin F2alpha synthase